MDVEGGIKTGALRTGVVRRAFVLAGAALLSLAVALACACAPQRAEAALLGAAAPSASGGAAASVAPAASAKNAAGGASVHALYRYGRVDGKNYASRKKANAKYDVTGDGKPDSVEVSGTPVEGDAFHLRAVVVSLKGGAARATVSDRAGISQVEVFVVTLKNGRPLLFVSAHCADGTSNQVLFQYAGGSFKAVVSNALLLKTGVSDARISSLKPVGNRVIVAYEFVSSVTGVSRTSFTYACKGAQLKRTSNNSSALRYATRAAGAYTKRLLKAKRALAVYRGADLKRKKFTVPKGRAVRPVALRLQGGRLLYRIAYGSKSGWMAAPASSSPVLAGTYGSVSLRTAPLAYSKTKRYGLSALQKLSDRALYLMRNEVFARHGQVFSSVELASRFSSAAWYEPDPDATVKLSAAESANVSLMLDIERNRKSPYVV